MAASQRAKSRSWWVGVSAVGFHAAAAEEWRTRLIVESAGCMGKRPVTATSRRLAAGEPVGGPARALQLPPQSRGSRVRLTVCAACGEDLGGQKRAGDRCRLCAAKVRVRV